MDRNNFVTGADFSFAKDAKAKDAVMFEQARCGEVFSKGSPGKILTWQLLFPKWVMLGGICVHGLVLPSKDGQISLLVTVEIQVTHAQPPCDWLFRNACRDFLDVASNGTGNCYMYGN
jgi:hypothetical protein